MQNQLQLTGALQQLQTEGFLNFSTVPTNPALGSQWRQQQLQALRLFLTPEQWAVYQQMVGQPMF